MGNFESYDVNFLYIIRDKSIAHDQPFLYSVH